MEDETLLVSGSRAIKDKAYIFDRLNECFPVKPKLLIHGGAPGVDQIAGQWALSHDIPIRIYRPNLKKWPIGYDKQDKWRAYTERDKQMVEKADHVVCIWDGKSGGTRKTRDYAIKCDKLYKTFDARDYESYVYNAKIGKHQK
jgi:hypothetical protein